MSKAMKIGAGVVGAVVVAAIVIAVVVVNSADRYLIDIVEREGEAATGTAVSVAGAEVSLREQRATLSGLRIANPEGFDTPYALEVDEIEVRIDAGSLASETLVVTDISVDGAILNAEQRGSRSNLTDLLDHMQSAPDEPAAEPPADEGRIIIDRFGLTGGRVQLTAERLDSPETLELDDVVVRDVGRGSGGATYAEATDAILGAILRSTRSAIRGRLEDAAGDAVRRELEDELRDRLDDAED